MKNEVKGCVLNSADPAYYVELRNRAQYNRNNPTEAESLLWNYLSGKAIGHKFRRQHIIGQYIVDFVCLEKSLVVEIDGGYHSAEKQQQEDALRTEKLNSFGYRVIRFTNEEIFTNIEQTLSKVSLALQLPL